MTTSTLWQVGPDGTCTYPAPLSQHARVSFPVRGTCHVCGATDVCGRLNSAHQIVCALCTMSGRG